MAAIVRPEFDAKYYLSEHADVVASAADPVLHYLRHGSAEGRRPTSWFDPVFYRARYLPRDTAVEPFFHYLTEGRELGLLPSPREDFLVSSRLVEENGVVPGCRPKNDRDFALATPFAPALIATTTERVAAIVHVFYPELFGGLLKACRTVPCHVDVFVSTDTAEKAAEIRNVARGFDKGRVDVRVLPNRGRDIGPMLTGFPDVFRDYDIFFHLHTKKSLHGGDPLEVWRNHLVDNLLGSPDIVASILTLLEGGQVGVVFPQHLYVLRGILNWGFDFEHAASLLGRAGVRLDKDFILEFPSGSMFWARTAAFRELLRLGLSQDDFEAEAGQVDGTLAHAIERTILVFAEAAGFSWAKVLRASDEYPFPQCVLPATTQTELDRALSLVHRVLAQPPRIGTSAVERAIPETRRFVFAPSFLHRPRLNLLVPTVNPSQTFGGVATALQLLRNLMQHWGERADYRIVATDAPIDSDGRRAFADFDLVELGGPDGTTSRLLIDGLNREQDALPVRSGDVFIATAWWTAEFAFKAGEFQEQFFGRVRDVVYFIQDYEPNFYGWGSRWILAENTYKRGERTIAIINSEELSRFFSAASYGFKQSFCLPYRLNARLDKLINPRTREKVVLIYGRPSVHRNAFEILLDGISLWQRRNPVLASYWRILSAGQEYPKDLVVPAENFTNLGKLNLEDYAYWLSRASIGISLMISPHPSYPPLEMAEAGLMTITNAFTSKDLGPRFPNVTSLDVLTPDAIADALDDCARRYGGPTYPVDIGRCAPNPLGSAGIDMFTVDAFDNLLQTLEE